MSGLIISGMHHSGTSVVAGLLAKSGWHPGTNLVPNDERSHKEFWEDAEFVSINRELLALPVSDPEMPNDWGLTGSIPKNVEPDEASLKLAKLYRDKRESANENWIAKDPRSSLTIPIWAEIRDLKFLFVYRNPWDVVESLMRYGTPFSGRADWALGAWRSYNFKLLKMCELLGPRCAVVSSATILRDPLRSIETISKWAGMETTGSMPQEVIDPNLFRDREEGTYISSIFRILNPDESKVVDELDSLALIARRQGQKNSRRTHMGNGAGTKKAIQVILPCKNDGQYLAEAIASVEEAAKQTEYPVEITIIDSLSDEEKTQKYLAKLSAAGYQVVRAEKAGLPAARNCGLAMSDSEIVLPLDADNRVRADAFNHAKLIFENDADVVYGKWQRFGIDTKIVVPPCEINWNAVVPSNTLDSCTLIRRLTLVGLGGWDENFTLGFEDWDLWLRAISKKVKFKFVDGIFFEYFSRPNSMTWELIQNLSMASQAYMQIVTKNLSSAKASGADTSYWESLTDKRADQSGSIALAFQRLKNFLVNRIHN